MARDDDRGDSVMRSAIEAGTTSSSWVERLRQVCAPTPLTGIASAGTIYVDRNMRSMGGHVNGRTRP